MSREPLWKCRLVESLENQKPVFHPSHHPWKSLRDSHIPTASTTVPIYKRAIGVLAGVLMLSGDRDRAQGLLDKLGSGQAYGAPQGLATFHLLCSDIDRAADWVEKAIEERNPSVLLSLRQPYAQPLRSSRHWQKLAKLMNLPPEAL